MVFAMSLSYAQSLSFSKAVIHSLPNEDSIRISIITTYHMVPSEQPDSDIIVMDHGRFVEINLLNRISNVTIETGDTCYISYYDQEGRRELHSIHKRPKFLFEEQEDYIKELKR
jgi:hypothetical protein